MEVLIPTKCLIKLHDIRHNMPLKLMRKLSFRHRKSPDRELKVLDTLRKASSCRGLLLRGSMSNMDVNNLPSTLLPRNVVETIIDECEFFDQLKLRCVSRLFKELVDYKLSHITHLEVKKTDISNLPRGHWQFCRNSQLAINIVGKKAKIVVDSKWTARDVQALVGVMSVFRPNAVEATIDAPIAELLVVSISEMDLNRWYAFQCFIKAMDAEDEDMHLQCDFTNPGEVYWPNLKYLTIRTAESEASHLERVIDYGVQCNWVLDRQNLIRLRIVFVDIDTTTKTVSKHLYHFRCWAGSAGFDHRFEQHFGVLI